MEGVKDAPCLLFSTSQHQLACTPSPQLQDKFVRALLCSSSGGPCCSSVNPIFQKQPSHDHHEALTGSSAVFGSTVVLLCGPAIATTFLSVEGLVAIIIILVSPRNGSFVQKSLCGWWIAGCWTLDCGKIVGWW